MNNETSRLASGHDWMDKVGVGEDGQHAGVGVECFGERLHSFDNKGLLFQTRTTAPYEAP